MAGYGNNFVPLTLELIEEGEFIERVREKFREAQVALIDHVAQFGEEAKKAKAKVDVSIEISVASRKDNLFAIKPKVKLETPGHPVRATAAFAVKEAGEDGQPMLFVRGSGSTQGDPSQMHLDLPIETPEDKTRSEAP